MLYNINKLKERLILQEIESINGDTLTLKNGTKITLYESDSDCCAYACGTWIAEDNFEGVITDMNYKYKNYFDGDTENAELKITIYHNQNRVAQADCYSDAGNGGYYFSVLSARVSTIDGQDVDDFRLLDSYSDSYE